MTKMTTAITGAKRTPSRRWRREQVGRRPWPRSRNGLSGTVGAARPNRRCRDVLIVKADRREPLVILRMSLAPEIAKPEEGRATEQTGVAFHGIDAADQPSLCVCHLVRFHRV